MLNPEEILHRLGIRTLSPMQQEVRKAFLTTDHDLVLLAPTGSGKTLAYALPLCEMLGATAGKSPATGEDYARAVILVPSRELAIQTMEVIKQAGCGIKAFALHGGRPTMDEHRRIREIRPDILIATPGRINDHLQKHNFGTARIATLVIDEFDKSLSLGFQEEMAEVIGRLPAVSRRILLSATDAECLPEFVDTSRAIRLDHLDVPLAGLEADERLDLRLVHSPSKDKLSALERLLFALGEARTLVFVAHRESADRVAGFLRGRGYACDTYHGGMQQADRERALYKFRGGSCPVLVATDLASRGLDIQGLENVVHYHLPASHEDFTHRNGRTARWQARGGAYLLLAPEEAAPCWAGEAEAFTLPEVAGKPFRPRWATLYIGKGKKDGISKTDVVGFLSHKGGLGRNDLGKVDVCDRMAFATVRREKLRSLLRLVQGEKIKGLKTIVEEAR